MAPGSLRRILEPFPAVNDGIHRRIQIETELERRIIDHPYFQRLRRIKQLGFSYYVFPNANHTRFEHCLGAMKLAGDFWETILKNTAEVINKANQNNARLNPKWQKYFATLNKSINKKKIRELLRLSALAHDLGHGPFSHLFEELAPTWRHYGRRVPVWLRPKRINQSEKVPHEIFSVLLLQKIFNDLKKDNFFQNQWINNDLFLKFFASITCEDVNADFSDDQLQKLVQFQLPPGSLQIVKSLISGMVDVDRMDYLYRDSYYAGVNYGFFDIDRIKESLVICVESESNVRMGLRHSGLGAFEHYLFCLYQMYIQIYFHKTVSACNSMLLFIHRAIEKEAKKKLDKFQKKYLFDIDGYGSLDEYEFIRNYKSLVSKTSALSAFQDLFEGRVLWKRILEINEDQDSEDIGDIDALLARKGFNNFISDRNKERYLLKGLRCKNQKDSLVLLERHLKIQIPQLKKLKDVSDLVNLYSGRSYKFHRIYAPSNDEKKIKNVIKKFYRLDLPQKKKGKPNTSLKKARLSRHKSSNGLKLALAK
ncbi:MAG TPA: HD domain-containing protein [bacterium]|nr:HD domain-containing protein [bacterium]